MNLNVSFDTDDDTVSVINGATNMVTATIPVNVLTGIAVDVDSNLIYVASRQSDTVSVIDGVTNTVTKVITLGTGVVGVAVDSGDNLIYVTDRFDNVVYVIDNNPLPSTGNGNGDSRHKTAPTSGLDWNTFKQIVEGGFTVNGKSIDIIDNWHTDFEKQKISIGKINSFGIKTYAQNNGLLFQEISFGIPKVGEYQNAEVIITVWYNHDKSIKDVTIEQDRYIIDSSSLQVLTSQIPCGYIDSTCYQTDIYAIFNEPLQYDVFAIKAVDMSRRSMMPTYLNEGFDISGHSLNPMQTKQIPGPEKYEGLITVTQLERFSDLWKTEDGRIFEMWGESNSFKLVYQPSEDKSQDTGSIKDRDHSSFYNWKQLQIDKAQEYFDSGIIQNGFPSSFTYYFEFDETLFDVEYTATNMAVSGIEADLDFISLILTVDIIDSPGTLDITFERYFFDSVYQGLDDDFIVLADGNKPNYTETETTTQSRTLSIELPAGTEEVEIIGSAFGDISTSRR